nr:triokinase {peptide 1} {EC 2.7.1.28} [Swine, kidney, Peptide Partial, 14 aa] [Sus scrofa]
LIDEGGAAWPNVAK